MDSHKFDCGLWTVFCGRLLAWLGMYLSLAISQTTYGMYSTGSQFSSASTIWSHLLSGIVFLVTRLLICWSSLSWLRPALVADLSVRPPRGSFWCHVLTLPPDWKGLFRLWVRLFEMTFPLNFVLCRGTFPVLFINSSRLFFGQTWAGSASEGAIYKLIDR